MSTMAVNIPKLEINASALIGSKVRPELPLYLQHLTKSITYLRRDLEETAKDRKPRRWYRSIETRFLTTKSPSIKFSDSAVTSEFSCQTFWLPPTLGSSTVSMKFLTGSWAFSIFVGLYSPLRTSLLCTRLIYPFQYRHIRSFRYLHSLPTNHPPAEAPYSPLHPPSFLLSVYLPRPDTRCSSNFLLLQTMILLLLHFSTYTNRFPRHLLDPNTVSDLYPLIKILL
jgi:hypothetical protein